MALISKLARKALDWAATNFLAERRIELKGEVYMRRFYVLGRLDDATAALWNVRTPKERLGWLPTVFLHCIKRPDADRMLHDHPWPAKGVILFGGYVEERYAVEDPRASTMRAWHARTPFDVIRLKLGQYHRIDALFEDESWTLFVCGPKTNSWGYWSEKENRHIPWREVHPDPNSDPE